MKNTVFNVIVLMLTAMSFVAVIAFVFSGIALVADGIVHGWGGTVGWYRYGGAIGFVWGALMALRAVGEILLGSGK